MHVGSMRAPVSCPREDKTQPFLALTRLYPFLKVKPATLYGFAPKLKLSSYGRPAIDHLIREHQNTSHPILPTQRSTSLMRRIIKCAVDPGTTILSIGAGTGTDLIAAALMGCHAVGLEADPTLYTVIGSRLREYASDEAKRDFTRRWEDESNNNRSAWFQHPSREVLRARKQLHTPPINLKELKKKREEDKGAPQEAVQVEWDPQQCRVIERRSWTEKHEKALNALATCSLYTQFVKAGQEDIMKAAARAVLLPKQPMELDMIVSDAGNMEDILGDSAVFQASMLLITGVMKAVMQERKTLESGTPSTQQTVVQASTPNRKRDIEHVVPPGHMLSPKNKMMRGVPGSSNDEDQEMEGPGVDVVEDPGLQEAQGVEMDADVQEAQGVVEGAHAEGSVEERFQELFEPHMQVSPTPGKDLFDEHGNYLGTPTKHKTG